ncbi:membrane dipeptidase [Conexibacter sp. SYSU D00693]|uniref:membrane dipeptidase n=1 Tax=Conexibacter sp. SYSU D00693 TaxID=2812560 RepID=UPI00196A21C2|nr:membrane dipeptidase [Conexibacter sp. SYSU D00693]
MGGRTRRAAATMAAALAALGGAQAAPAASVPELANRCVALEADGGGRVAPLFSKPATLHTVLLRDRDGRLLAVDGPRTTWTTAQPGPRAEWAVRRTGRRTVLLRSTHSGRDLRLAADGRLSTVAVHDGTPLRITAAGACSPFPEAGLDAAGTPGRPTRKDGTVRGFADPHVHLAADLRAGGRVIHGAAFDRFGISRALGGDERDHGPRGALDLTGNLLRDGVPVGTHETDGWPTFRGWPTHDTNTHQQTYWRWLERAWLGGMRLVVAQTVEDQPLCTIEPLKSHSCDEMDTAELQVRRLRALEDYVDAQAGGPGRGFLRIVTGPGAARKAIDEGKLAVVLGVEASNLFGCSQLRGVPACDRDDIDAGIRRLRALGIRAAFLTHWVDNALGGAALEGGDKGLFISAMHTVQTATSFKTGPCPDPAQGEEPSLVVPSPLEALVGPIRSLSPEPLPLYPPGRQCNARGLTDLGRYAVRRMMDAHLLIDADHLGEWGREELLELTSARGYPVVSSHTDTGGPWSASELRRLFAGGGFAAVRAEDAPKLPEATIGLATRHGTPFGVGLATDTGGFATQPAPLAGTRRPPLAYPLRSHDGKVRFDRQRTGERVFDLNADGVAHYGLLPDLLADVARQPEGRRALGVLFRGAEAYLRTWERTGSR